MKKAIAICLSLLVLFNALGFYTIFLGWQYKNETALLDGFDNDVYDVAHAVTIKIPLAIPYASDQKEFQRVNGDFEHNGELYRLVKQRLSNDTLEIVCVKDVQNKRIHQALKDYVKTFTDKSADAKSSGSKIQLSFIKDYYQSSFSMSQQNSGWSKQLGVPFSQHNLISDFFHEIVHPPEKA